MSAQEDGEATSPEVHAIGISFGNSNSSIAYTSGVCTFSSKPWEPAGHKQEAMIILNLVNRKARLKSLQTKRETAKFPQCFHISKGKSIKGLKRSRS